MLKEVEKYQTDILSGKIPSGELLRLAIERQIKDLKKVKNKSYPYYFDEESAERIIKFCGFCCHWKGAKARQPIQLEANQKWRLAVKYGWREKGTGLRRFRKTYEEVARKNAKTTEKALEAIYHMMLDGGIGAQVVAAATKSDQAKLVVNDAGKIISASPKLKNKGFRLFKMNGKVYEIHYPGTESSMYAIGRDSDNQDGLDPSFGIIDEYHAHKDDDILNVVESGQGARLEPILAIITTAGFNMDGPCYQIERRNAIEILKGKKKDESYFISIYAPDKADQERLERIDPSKVSKHKRELKEIFHKSNPNLDASVLFKNLMKRFVDSFNKGGSAMVNFLTKDANMWVDAPETWIPGDIWRRNTVYSDLQMWPAGSEPFGNNTYLLQHRIVSLSYVEEHLRGRTCYGGLDLSSKLDFSALVYVFEPDDDGIVPILPYVWTTEAYLKKIDLVNVYEWVNEGFLVACKGELISHKMIFEKIKETCEMFNVLNIAYDAAFAGSIIEDCEEEYGDLLVSFGQGIMKVSEPTKLIESTCYAMGSEEELQGFEHFNNPVLSWMIGNVEIVRDNNANIRVTKKDPKRKVDAVAALVNAMAMQLYYEHVEGGTIEFISEAG